MMKKIPAKRINMSRKTNCKTKYCRNDAAPRKGGLCHKCYQKKWKKNNPFKYYFNVAKQNAKNRGIPWKLSFEQWKRIWVESGHWEDKLKQASNDDITWTLDRQDVNRGYVPGNVQVMEKWRNVHKWIKEDRFNIEVAWRKRWAKRNGKSIDSCPF